MRENKLGKRIAFILLAIVCVIWLFPLIWAIFTSFKSEAEIQKVGFSLIPQDWTLTNFWACYKAMILLLCSAGL